MPTTASAPDLRRQISALLAERALATLTGLTGNRFYMDDLEDEIAETHAAYVGAAVTEIASLRAVLDAPLAG